MTPRDKAQEGRRLLEEAVLEILANHPDGLQNVQVASLLDIHSHYRGAQKDYLSWSILGLLLNENRVVRTGRKYKVA